MLFVIYFGRVLGNCEAKLALKYQIECPKITTRSERSEHQWCRQQEYIRFRKKGERKPKQPVLLEQWTWGTSNDMHVFADDITIKTTGSGRYTAN